MPQYLVANYLPDDFDPSALTEAMMEDIHALNSEMIAAGARKFRLRNFPRRAGDMNEIMKASEQRRRQNTAR